MSSIEQQGLMQTQLCTFCCRLSFSLLTSPLEHRHGCVVVGVRTCMKACCVPTLPSQTTYPALSPIFPDTSHTISMQYLSVLTDLNSLVLPLCPVSAMLFLFHTNHRPCEFWYACPLIPSICYKTGYLLLDELYGLAYDSCYMPSCFVVEWMAPTSSACSLHQQVCSSLIWLSVQIHIIASDYVFVSHNTLKLLASCQRDVCLLLL